MRSLGGHTVQDGAVGIYQHLDQKGYYPDLDIQVCWLLLFDRCCCNQLNFRGWLQTEIANFQKLKRILQATTKPDCQDLSTMNLHSNVSSLMNLEVY